MRSIGDIKERPNCSCSVMNCMISREYVHVADMSFKRKGKEDGK